MYLLALLFVLLGSSSGATRDLSGSYTLEDCSCTVLQCPPRFLYQFTQNVNGDLSVTYLTYRAAQGKVTTFDISGRTELTLQWLPGMDFDTTCTGVSLVNQRSIDLKCGDQLRFCSGRFQLIKTNRALPLGFSPSVIFVFFLFILIEKINE